MITRFNTLNENSTAQWGKMNIYQMLKHSTFYEEWIIGKNKYKCKQKFIGGLLGKIALKDLIKDENPMKRNMPSLSELKVRENGKVEPKKRNGLS